MNILILAITIVAFAERAQVAARLAYAALAVATDENFQLVHKRQIVPNVAPQQLTPSTDAPGKPAVQCLVFTMHGCLPCRRFESSVTRNLLPQGWRASNDEAADIRFIPWETQKSLFAKFKVEQTPTLILLKNGQERKRWPNAIHVNVLAEELNHLRLEKP